MNLDKTKKFVFTIFGASGDLAFLKIFPAIYELYVNGSLNKDFWIVGYARSNYNDDSFRNRFKESIKNFVDKKIEDDELDDILSKVFYVQGQYGNIDDFKKYQAKVNEITNGKYDNEIFHFSTPPEVYENIVKAINKLTEDKYKIRLIFEKPFGKDYNTALKLSHYLGEKFPHNDVYLLDHYLGKPQVRSLLVLREKNKFLSELVQGKNVEKIIIKALESKEVENRLSYYDQVGATRDMIQSHLLQLVALLLMDIPVKVDMNTINTNKKYILDSLYVEESVFGQYENYCENKEYKCSPFTETFVASKLFLNIDEWFKIPIYLITGKALSKKETTVEVEFKRHEFQSEEIGKNSMEFVVYPKAQLKLKMIGAEGENTEISLNQDIECNGDNCLSPHATLLCEAINGDKTYFLDFQQVLAGWKLTEKILKQKKDIFRYEHGDDNFVNEKVNKIGTKI